MRRRLVTALSLVVVGLLALALVGPASSAGGRDLTVSDLQEPPDFAAPGSSFRESFSVANQGSRGAGKKTTTRFFLDQTPDSSSGRTGLGKAGTGGLGGNDEQSGRAKLKVPAGLAAGNYFLVACADAAKKLKESKEKNNCRISGQSVGVGLTGVGPAGPRGTGTQTTIDRFTLPIGRATILGFHHAADGGRGRGFEGDDEKSNQRREIAKVGPVSLVADCKRTTNGNDDPADNPFISPNNFDENGDEAKILVYTDSGTVTFNSLGESARKNIPPGEGATEDQEPSQSPEPGDYTQAEESDGGEGAHQAIAAARDPDQTAPEEDWAFAYKVGTIYINHSGGQQLIFTGYAGIDILGAEDQCVFGGVLKVAKSA